MESTLLKRYFLAISLIIGFCVGHAQNLVPNYSFENISSCPEFFGQGGPTLAPPWTVPTQGSADVFNECCTTGQVDVPNNFFGSQPALTGVGYAGFYTRLNAFLYREYIQAPLDEPLVAGTWYAVSFYVSPADNGCAIEHIGAYLSVDAPGNGGFAPFDLTPQVVSTEGFINDFDGWTLVSGCFLAEGGEAHITLGNFESDADNPMEPGCNQVYSYYYIDDVTVIESMPPESIDFDLGGPVEACFEYEIDPMLDGYYFIWEGGSHGPTLTVTETGIYSLTLTDGCNFGVDSIEVTILGSHDPIDIGPDELTFCAGEEYVITLDPDLSVYTWQDGSNDSEYTITTTGVYSVTLDDGCSQDSDEIDITVIDPPDPISLGDDMFLCLGDELQYSFDPALGDFLWQDGSTLSTFTVTEGGVYSLVVSNMCGDEEAEVIITDLEVPEIDLGPDEVVICDGEILEIEIDPELGDIVWQDGSTLPNYEITSPGVYTVFVSNLCGTASDQVDVSVSPAPLVDLGPDTIMCTNEDLLLTTPFVDGTYEWQDGSTNEDYLVNSSGEYILTVTTFCGFAADTINVEFVTPLVVPNLGPDASLCPGEELVLYAGNPGAEYLWQDFSTADTLVVSGSGTYFVQVFNDCGLVSDTIEVTVNDSPPMVDLPDQLTLCQGATTTINSGVSGVSYLWSDGSTAPQLVVNASGTYSLTVTNTCGTDRDTVIVNDGGPAPLVSLGTDTSLCSGTSVVLLPTNSNVDTWLWSDGSTLPSFTITGAGQYTVEVNNSCGTSYDTINAVLLPDVPPLDLGPDTSLCAGQQVVLSISTPNVDILWSDGSTGPMLTTSAEGLYAASIANSCGTSYDTMEVTFLPDIPSLNLGPDQSLCPGETVIIDPGIANVSYQWQDGSTAATYETTQEETVILIISNTCGTATDTVEIFENSQGPLVDLGPDILACDGDVITIPAGVSGVNYLWQDGSTASSFVTSVSSEVILQVSNSCGTDTDTVLVDIHGSIPVVNLGPDTSLCEGEILVLTSSADAETFVEWQNGSALASFVVSTAGVYSLYESNHCGEDTDTVSVSYNDAPDPFSLGPDMVLCPGEMLTLTAPPTTFDLMWQDGSDQNTFVADQEDVYWLQISNECGSMADTVVLQYDNLVAVLNLDPKIPWCEGDVITLDAAQPFTAQYVWSTGATSASIQVNQPAIYSVVVTTDCSTANQDVEVYPGDDCVIPEVFKEIYVPNVFSPNNDNINDVFLVSFGSDLEVTGMEGTIFDRWGNLVYNSKEIPFSWDGFFRNEALQPGVFAYVIKLTYLDGGLEREVLLSGDVTLVK